MGGYYVPNIQRRGFNYQRSGEDDEDQFDDGSNDWGGGDGGTPASDGPSASSATDSYTPPTPEAWTAGGELPFPEQWTDYRPTRDFSLPSRGGADTAPTATEMNLGGAEPPVPQDAEPPSGTDIPGIGQAPMGRPSRVPPPVSSHAEEEKLKQMIKAGPKRSILGTIAAAAAGFGAGYVNAAGRTRNPVPVPKQFMRNVSLRAPGGGAWDTQLARQQQLAEQEQGEEKRALSAYQLQAQAEERAAQAEELRQRGTYLGEQAETNRKWREEQDRNNKFQRIMTLGGRGSTDVQRVDIPPGGKPPAGDGWYVDVNPYKPGYQIAVRPNPGKKISPELGKRMNIEPDSEGNYYATPSMLNADTRAEIQGYQTQLREAQADKKRAEDDLKRIQQGKEFDLRFKELQLQHQRQQDEWDDKRTDKTNKTLSDAQAQKDRDLIDADKRFDAKYAKEKATLGKVKAPVEQKFKQQRDAEKLIAYNKYAVIIRQNGGRAWDASGVDEDGNPVQGTEAYALGETPRPVGTPAPPAPAPPVTTNKPSPLGAPVVGGGGGRGSVNLPPKLSTAPQPGKTITRAKLQKYADEETGGDFAAAQKIFTDKGWTVAP